MTINNFLVENRMKLIKKITPKDKIGSKKPLFYSLKKQVK